VSTSPNLLTSVEVAKMLGITHSTLRSWRFRGEGPPSVKVGVAVIYRIEDVETWMRKNHHQEEAESA